MFRRAHIRTQATLLVLMDLLCLSVGCAVGIIWRIPEGAWLQYFMFNTTSWVVLFSSVILANYLAGSYRIQYTFSRFNLVVIWMFSIAAAVLLMSFGAYVRMITPLGRGVLWRLLLVYSVLILSLKMLVYRRLFRSSIFVCRTVILGTGEKARNLRDIMQADFVLPRHNVVAYLDTEDSGGANNRLIDGVAVIKSDADALEEVVKSLGANLIVIGLEKAERIWSFLPRLRKLRFDGIEILNERAAVEIYTGRAPVDQLDEDFLTEASMESGLPTSVHMKRLLDTALSLSVLVLLSPLFLFIALLIKLSAPGSPVFYSQVRVGQFGKEFRIYKFRTMRAGAEDETGPVWADGEDPRITLIGKFLRRVRLDEFPQFWNVLKGEMSVVGPRPERPQLVEQLAREIAFFRERENALPGLTGWAQVRYPYGDSVEDAKRKLEFDIYYIKNMSLSLDLQIMLSTIRIVLFGMEREH